VKQKPVQLDRYAAKNTSVNRDLQNHLSQSGVTWSALSESKATEAEETWRGIYGRAFIKRPRCKQGNRAVFEYEKQSCDHYLIVPFSSNVDGLPVAIDFISIEAYECRGPLTNLGRFHNAEFFISPIDLSWTMIHDHEDHAHGGPYFIREEWIV
jgi:hypothetical protein